MIGSVPRGMCWWMAIFIRIFSLSVHQNILVQNSNGGGTSRFLLLLGVLMDLQSAVTFFVYYYRASQHPLLFVSEAPLKREEVYLMHMYLSSLVRRARLLWGFFSFALVAALLLAACGGGGTTTASTPTATSQPTPSPTATTAPSTTATVAKVKIIEKNDMYMFDPATLTIKTGTQVVWTNT